MDASTLSFVAPPDKSLADEFARQAAAAGAPVHMEMPSKPQPRANIQIGTRPWFITEVTPKEFCEKELRAMLVQVGGKLGELTWATMGGHECAVLSVEVQMDGLAAKQLHALGVVGAHIVHFCGTSALGDYAKFEQSFIDTMASFEIEQADAAEQ